MRRLAIVCAGSIFRARGGAALAIMMVPTITRATEEMLLLVPHAIREAALGLGIPQWRSTLSITLRTALPGVVTGLMLAFARVAGETRRCCSRLLATVLEYQPQSADRRASAADLRLRHFTV